MTAAVQLERLEPGARPGGRGRSALWAGALVAYLVGTGVLAHSSSYEQGLLLVAAVYSILALSLDLVAGATGLYSLGHAGLFAIGAYGTTILSTHYGWNIFLALPVTVLAVGLVGVVIGALSLRVSGLYFAITTLIFTIIVNVLISDLNITGGYTGLASPPFPNFPHALSFVGSSLAWAVCGALLITVTLIWSIRSSALYPALASHPRFRAVRFLCWGPHIGHPSCHLQPVSRLGRSCRLDLQLPRLHHARSVRLDCRGQHLGHGDPWRDEHPHRPNIRCRVHQPVPDGRQHEPALAGNPVRLHFPVRDRVLPRGFRRSAGPRRTLVTNEVAASAWRYPSFRPTEHSERQRLGACANGASGAERRCNAAGTGRWGYGCHRSCRGSPSRLVALLLVMSRA